MEPRLAVRVQHHPSRAELLPRLLEQLVDFDDVAVVADPGGERPIDSWRSHRLCLTSLLTGAKTHLLSLQDDALLQLGFAAGLERALERFPDRLICLFVPGFGRDLRLMRAAHGRGEDFMPFQVAGYVPLVATVYPRALAEQLVDWTERLPRLRGADDSVVARFCRLRRIQPLATVPCLVEHDEDVPRVGRQARKGAHRRAALL